MVRRSRKSSRKSRRSLRRRRVTRRAKRQRGGDGDIPDDQNVLVSMRDGNDPDSVETVVSKAKFDEVSRAPAEAAAI